MKGRYSGCHMTIYGTLIPGAISIARWANKVDGLTSEAKQRLKVVDWHRSHDSNISLTARRFGLTRLTVRNWVSRFNQGGVLKLNDQSKRPKHLRQPVTPWETVKGVVDLRKKYPAWSKYKLAVMLKRQGLAASPSTIGRILKRKGLINQNVSRKRQRSALHPKARFPKGLRVSCPGDMIQVDTKYICLAGGHKFYQFTAIDVLTKNRVLDVYPSQSSRNGADFLKQCEDQFPFPIKAVQTDNGAPFLKDFDKLCSKKQLPHYYIYPRTPKQNTYVEISHGADEREFYQQGNVRQQFHLMRQLVKDWEVTWNEVRPHQALNYSTPKEYLEKWQSSRLPTRDVITLQT